MGGHFIIKFDIRYANHPDDSKHYDTKELREKYLIKKLLKELKREQRAAAKKVAAAS